MWSLKIVEGAELAERLVPEVRLPSPLTRFVIGRDPGSAWAIADRTLALSARHCEIVATAQGPVLRDLSTNGTFVNGATARLAAEHPLRDGDRVQIGPYLIAVSGPAVASPRPAPEAAPPASPEAPAVHPVRSPGGPRGGDPAAMHAAQAAGGGPVGLTEILRVASSVPDSGMDLTRIRVAPPPAAPRAAPSSTAPAPAPAPAPVPAPAPPELRQALARGLGMPEAALAGDPLVWAERVARLAAAAVEALRHLPAPGPATGTWRGAPDATAALLALLREADPAATLQRSEPDRTGGPA